MEFTHFRIRQRLNSRCNTFLMISGDMIDCYTHGGAVLLPQDHNEIDHMETSASFVLLVEKDTLFQN
ncbi:unnamed protein product [Ceratitis capitata]|uniref:(Mediterranean fruit fly) hypothetical protein n=1 Tax=Ceratitis capitata TaxID=7213 RepID=A0A811V9A0_CERCA|nr:unnamed protein product [Ceratitis capitata]